MALILLTLIFVASGCSSPISRSKSSIGEDRKIANDNFKCSIKEDKREYTFTPSLLKLEIKEGVSTVETIFLQENDLLSGGFSYIPDDNNRGKGDIKKIDFYSFVKSPSLSIEFKKRLGMKPLVLSALCMSEK